MFANVKVLVGEPEPVLTVPATAVTYSLYGDAVFVVAPKKAAGTSSAAGDGKAAEPALEAERRFVKVGELRDDRVAVLEGLKEGEQVVTVGQLKLRPGSSIRVDNTVKLEQTGEVKVE